VIVAAVKPTLISVNLFCGAGRAAVWNC